MHNNTFCSSIYQNIKFYSFIKLISLLNSKSSGYEILLCLTKIKFKLCEDSYKTENRNEPKR